jgi:hypothetical protein
MKRFFLIFSIFSMLILFMAASQSLLFAQETDEDVPPETVFPPLSTSIILVRPSEALTSVPQVAAAPSVPRTVHGIVGQLVDILFPGSGWVYLGEAEARSGVVYNSRRVEKSGQCLVFRAESAGTYSLRFYKQDFIRDELINEEVRLIVSEVNVRQDASWTDATVVQNVESAPPPSPSAASETPELPAVAPVDYLQQARDSYTQGKFGDALAALEAFRERYPLGSDEVWWLYGQTLEANSDRRDIRSSLDYYRRLLREYPQSSLCSDAHKRVAWLERYFFIQ